MGNQASVKNHLENASKTGIFNLSNNNITKFPEELIKVKATVRSIDLSNNKLKIIPDVIGTFPNLRHLNLSNNKLHNIPDTIGDIKKLESLMLEGNLLSSLPSSLSKLTNLRKLTLSNNGLTQFPLEVCTMNHLEVLDISKNKLTSIPDGVASLQITELNVNQNQIGSISDEIGLCARLKVLRVEENCLPATAIPKRLLQESNVNLIAYEGNLFEPKDFQGLEGHDSYLERYTASKKKIF